MMNAMETLRDSGVSIPRIALGLERTYQNVPKKNDSRGWCRESPRDPGFIMKRMAMHTLNETNSTRSKMKKIFPMVKRPSNLKGCWAKRTAMAPVAMVHSNHAYSISEAKIGDDNLGLTHVKWPIRSFHDTSHGSDCRGV